jgi:hypothetical protein
MAAITIAPAVTVIEIAGQWFRRKFFVAIQSYFSVCGARLKAGGNLDDENILASY